MTKVKFLESAHDNPPDNTLQYRAVRWLLLLSGLSFRRYRQYSTSWDRYQIIRAILAIVYLIIVVYILFRLLLVLVVLDNNWDESGLLIVYVLTTWYIKSFLSMIFVVYWEFRSRNQYVMELTLNLRCNRKDSNRDWAKIVTFVGFGLIFGVRILGKMLTVVAHSTNRNQTIFVDYLMYTAPFGRNFGSALTIAFLLHAFLIDLIVLCLYATCVYSLRYRILCLKDELEHLGTGGKSDKTVQFYDGYRSLMIIISNLFSHFQLYRLISLASSIVILALSIIGFTIIHNNKTWIDYILVVFEVFNTSVIITILVYPCSAVRNILLNIKGILYFNKNLWVPYNQHVYELTKCYIQMAELTLAQITFFGSSTVQKPVVVTGSFIGGLLFLFYTKVLDPYLK
ncbi:hypothetical protein M3Y94_01267100 [Aphelenchoides besseyi]|nr:hypothetical protein M3Y94_01267100 [Aphelenchoides besseyi]KAI6222599.1 hypothetical protein M3Y95_00910700 [Aphelenchoides besseyi]